MKKIIKTMAVMAAAFAIASCSREQLVETDVNATAGESVITASIDNDLTKTTLSGDDTAGYEVFWSEGDKLFVSDANIECWAAVYTLDRSSAGSSNGLFGWHEGDTFVKVDENCQRPAFQEDVLYMALYPYDIIDLDNDYRITWKTEQTYSVTDRYIPMFSLGDCENNGNAHFVFSNLGGLLRLTVKGTATVRSIKISAANDEAMSGEIRYVIPNEDDKYFAYMATEIDGIPLDTRNYITLDCGTGGVDLSPEGTDFHISIPLGEYTDVSIALTDMNGNVCEKKLKDDNQLVIRRSEITVASFTASDFHPQIAQ